MKYSEAIKIAMSNPDFVNAWDASVKSALENHREFSMLFSFEGNYCESFHVDFNHYWSDQINEYETYVTGGKHSPKRALYLTHAGKTFTLPAVKTRIVIR